MNHLLHRTFWHGTTTAALDAILAEGLVPERSKVGYNCLTSEPEAAIFWGRLNAFIQYRAFGCMDTNAVLIRIAPETIPEDAVVPEARSATLSCYGSSMPGRAKDQLLSLADDWPALLAATDCIGVKAPLRVTRDMIEVVELPFYETYDQVLLFKEEKARGVCPPEVRSWLDERIASSTDLALAG